MDILQGDLKIDGYDLVNFLSLTDNELEAIRRWRNTESIRKWMYTDRIITEEEHKQFVNSLKHSEDKAYWLVKQDDLKIGVLYFININFRHRRAYFGIYANPEERVAGAGRILDNLAKKVAFDVLNLHTLKLEVIEDNIHVINLHKKQGFKEEIEGENK